MDEEEFQCCPIPGKDGCSHLSTASRIEKLQPIDLADFIAEQPTDEKSLLIFNEISGDKAVKTFEYLPHKVQKAILEALGNDRQASLLNALSPDDRTALLEELPAKQVTQLLKYLSPEERAVSVKLLGYPKNSVGRLMTPDYVAIRIHWTVGQVLDYIREKGQDSETLNVIYAVDDKGVLLDDFKIREFLLAPLNKTVESLADRKFISLSVEEDEKEAILTFRKYARTALPVIDDNGVLLGIVTVDDIIAVGVQEDTKDMLKIGGMETLTEPYLAVPLETLFTKRVGCLVLLFIGELFTATAMGYFQDEIAKAVVLALFLPLIISSGGNAGSQASTLIVRAMALGEVTMKDWWQIMRREVITGLCLGCVLGVVGFLRVAIWSAFLPTYGEHWLLLAITIFISLIGVVLWGSLSGSMLPLLLEKCGFDPAASSAPFVATLVDVTGVIIYFSVALLILTGTLL